MKTLVLFTAFCLSMHAQQTPRFSSSRTAVRLMVSVTQNGNAMRGLTRSDFAVTDNGKKQSVEVTELTDTPLDLVVLGQPIESIAMTSAEQATSIARALTAVFQNVTPADRVGAILAGAPPTRLRRVEIGPLAIGPRDFQRGAYAAPLDAIIGAIGELPDTDRPRAVVALTNGADFRSTASQRQVGQRIEPLGPELFFISAPIVVQTPVVSSDVKSQDRLVSGRTFPAALRAMASKSGGTVLDLSQGAPEALIAALFSQLRSQYVVSYDAPEGKGWHSVSVKVGRRGGVVRTREGYQQK